MSTYLWRLTRGFAVRSTRSLHTTVAFCSGSSDPNLPLPLTLLASCSPESRKGQVRRPLCLAVLPWHFWNLIYFFSRLLQINGSIIFSVFLGSEARLYIIPLVSFFLLLCQVPANIFGENGWAGLPSSRASSYHHGTGKSRLIRRSPVWNGSWLWNNHQTAAYGPILTDFSPQKWLVWGRNRFVGNNVPCLETASLGSAVHLLNIASKSTCFC